MPDANVPYREEAFQEEKVKARQYDRGIRDDGSDGAVQAREERRNRLNYDENEATAPGKICELCGSVISAGQQARLRPSGWWVHEACPIQ
jgi:hypothetical protein